MFRIREVAKNLGVSVQAIYNRKEDLIGRGYMYKNSNGNWEISDSGYNYLVDNSLNKFNKDVKDNLKDEKFCYSVNTDFIEVPFNDNSLNFNSTGLINLYENRIKELKENFESQLNEQKQQTQYFKNLYENEKSERIQISTQYHTYLLGASEQNISFFDKVINIFKHKS